MTPDVFMPVQLTFVGGLGWKVRCLCQTSLRLALAQWQCLKCCQSSRACRRSNSHTRFCAAGRAIRCVQQLLSRSVCVSRGAETRDRVPRVHIGAAGPASWRHFKHLCNSTEFMLTLLQGRGDQVPGAHAGAEPAGGRQLALRCGAPCTRDPAPQVPFSLSGVVKA